MVPQSGDPVLHPAAVWRNYGLRAAFARPLGLVDRLSIDAYRRRRSRLSLAVARYANGIQLSTAELRPIVDAILARNRSGRLLVFGLGRDSRFWKRVNSSGTTLFLEDQREWIALVKASARALDVHAVDYTTTVAGFRSALESGTCLSLQLPERVREEKWDVVLVDGPAGWRPTDPGRVQSIYTALQVLAPDGDLFVHDVDREVERETIARFATPELRIGILHRLAHLRVVA